MNSPSKCGRRHKNIACSPAKRLPDHDVRVYEPRVELFDRRQGTLPELRHSGIESERKLDG